MSNQKYLKKWDDYQNYHLEKQKGRAVKTPILLLVLIDISAKGELVRERILAPDVKKLYMKCKGDIPSYMFDKSFTKHDPDKIFKDYVNYFAKIDGVQGPGVPCPLDLHAKMPVWILYVLPRKNWKFSKNCQHSVENDRDDMLRNFTKICTLDKMNALLLLNAHMSGPRNLKFNLHVDVNQTVDGVRMKTPIIIDPGQDNDPPFGFNQ